ncbi:hypothetical protein [Plantactinospora sp. CA-290183]|uniref:hypothetical protein n=1 Tax=Plantactinospora sp. CA-290183 TaxID=3240006 RepID=UPI003D8DAAD4
MGVGLGRAAARLGVAATVGALLAPWAHYGQYEIALHRLPGWSWYLGVAALMHGHAGWTVFRAATRGRAAGPGRRTLLVTGLVLCAATLLCAVALLRRYDDAGTFFGPIVPLVRPVPGLGGPLALLGALASVVAIRAATRPDGVAGRSVRSR